MKSQFDKVFPLMTEGEQETYTFYAFAGIYNSHRNFVLMGEDVINRVEDFKQKMINKYEKEV